MERKLNDLGNSHVEVVVTVDEKTWKDAQEKAFKKVASNVTVAGFRKGKAPENLVKSRVDQVKVMDEAINGLIPTLYKDILDNEDIKPFAQPKIDVTKLSDKELEVKFTIITAPTVKLGAYTGLSIGKKDVKVTDGEVNDAINTMLAQNATLVVKDGSANKGDTVVMDFKGTVNGEAFEGGSANNHELELGSNSFIPGFEDQLVGAKAGDHIDVKVTFPENYTPELKGKDAVFGCDIHEVKEKKLPALDDEFIKGLKLPGVENLDSLKASKKAELLANKEREARSEFLGKLFETIKKDSKISIPEEIIAQQVASRKADMENRMKQSGLTFEQYLTFVGQKEEEFMAKLKDQVLVEVSNYFIMEEVGAKEKLNEITDADLEFEYSKIADQYKMKIEDVKKALAAQSEDFKQNIKMQRIEDFLFNKNN